MRNRAREASRKGSRLDSVLYWLPGKVALRSFRLPRQIPSVRRLSCILGSHREERPDVSRDGSTRGSSMSAPLSAAERIEIERACERLILAYSRALDLNDMNAAADCF